MFARLESATAKWRSLTGVQPVGLDTVERTDALLRGSGRDGIELGPATDDLLHLQGEMAEVEPAHVAVVADVDIDLVPRADDVAAPEVVKTTRSV